MTDLAQRNGDSYRREHEEHARVTDLLWRLCEAIEFDKGIEEYRSIDGLLEWYYAQVERGN